MITKVVQKADAARRTQLDMCIVDTHLPVSAFHTLRSPPPETTRRLSGDMATHLTYNEDTSQEYYKSR